MARLPPLAEGWDFPPGHWEQGWSWRGNLGQKGWMGLEGGEGMVLEGKFGDRRDDAGGGIWDGAGGEIWGQGPARLT